MVRKHSPRPSHLPDVRRSGRSARSLVLALAAPLVLLVAASSFVAVDETENVIIERLGEIVAVYDRDDDRGLHLKFPWPIETVRRFDRRVQFFSPPGREVLTRDKKNVVVGTYVCWKIADPTAADAALTERPVVRFFRGLGAVPVAEARIESRLRSILGTEMGQVELGSLLGVEHSEAGPDHEARRLEQIAVAVRDQLSRPDEEGESLTDRLGIEIVDVGIRQFQLPAGNQQAVFERMRSERRKIADGYRSAGMAENRMIMSRADRQAEEILARARADAERIRGEGEAEAIAILNRAHARDPKFYRISRTLDAYRQILNDKTTLVLSADNPLLKLLTEGIPDLPRLPEDARPAGTSEDGIPPASTSGTAVNTPAIAERSPAPPSPGTSQLRASDEASGSRP